MKLLLLLALLATVINCSDETAVNSTDITFKDSSLSTDTKGKGTEDVVEQTFDIDKIKAIRGKMISTGSGYVINADNGKSFLLKFSYNITWSGFGNAMAIVDGAFSESNSSVANFEVEVGNFSLKENGYNSEYVRADGKISDKDGVTSFTTNSEEYTLLDFDESKYEEVDFTKDVFVLAETVKDSELKLIFCLNSEAFGPGYDNSAEESEIEIYSF